MLSNSSSTDLQSDLNNLYTWCSKWKLTLNMTKCSVVHFTKQPKQSNASYIINNHNLSESSHQRDLGIIITENLSWSSHYNLICSKAYRALNLIRRSIPQNTSVSTKKTLYVTLVRSHLSYCCQIWRPYQVKDIIQLERIQRRATKYIVPDLPYKSRLIKLNLLPLMYWLELQDLYFFIKCIKDPPDNFNILDYVSFSTNNTRSASSNKLVPNFSYYRSSRHFYFNRIIRLWNKLPVNLFSMSDSLPSIKI